MKSQQRWSRTLEVDLAAVHEFYQAVQESPLLYPYFMDVKKEKRENVMQKIACSFHKALQHHHTMADSESLVSIHKNLNIDETAYNEFTNLFAHICCRGKSDKLRARMLKSFAKLKSKICTTSVEKHPANLAYLYGMLNLNSKSDASVSPQDLDQVERERNTGPGTRFLPDSARQGKVWNDKSPHKNLLKKITELESRINQLVDIIQALNVRLQVMEPNGHINLIGRTA